jgi:dihydrofolate reductase
LIDGFNDAEATKTFLKANIESLLTVCSPEKSAKLIVMLGSGPIIKFFTNLIDELGSIQESLQQKPIEQVK